MKGDLIMDQQYTYYTPNQNGSQNPYREPEKKPDNPDKGQKQDEKGFLKRSGGRRPYFRY